MYQMGENLMDDECYNGLYSLFVIMDFQFTSTIFKPDNPDLFAGELHLFSHHI